MSVLYIALPVALGLVAVFAWAFVRTVEQGAYDDLETPALRAIADDEPVPALAARSSTASDPSAQPEGAPTDGTTTSESGA